MNLAAAFGFVVDGAFFCRSGEGVFRQLDDFSRSAAARKWVGAVRPHTRTYSFEKE